MFLALAHSLNLDIMLCFSVFFAMSLRKICCYLMVRGRIKVSKRNLNRFQERILRQAHTPKALIQAVCLDDSVESEGEYDSFKGKDRHDTDGSLSLGMGQATGRVDVPVGVTLSAEELCRSGQSVALVSPGSCVVKTIFVKGGWMGTLWYTGYMSALLWVTCWIA